MGESPETQHQLIHEVRDCSFRKVLHMHQLPHVLARMEYVRELESRQFQLRVRIQLVPQQPFSRDQIRSLQSSRKLRAVEPRAFRCCRRVVLYPLVSRGYMRKVNLSTLS